MWEITYSPTVSLVSILTTLAIDAYEGRNVAKVDVPGAYLHADMPQTEGKTILLKLKGDFVDIMCSVSKKCTQHVVYEGKANFLDMKVLRAIYGCLASAMLWWRVSSLGDTLYTVLSQSGIRFRLYS